MQYSSKIAKTQKMLPSEHKADPLPFPPLPQQRQQQSWGSFSAEHRPSGAQLHSDCGIACSSKSKSRLWHEHVPPLFWKQKSTRYSGCFIHHRHQLPSHRKQEPNSASSITTGLQFAAQAVLKSSLGHQYSNKYIQSILFQEIQVRKTWNNDSASWNI